MTTPTVQPATPPPVTPSSDLHEAERVDAAKTADDAPAPVHPPRERDMLVRDAYGHDPYVADTYGPDGERDAVVLGQPPDELPDPLVAALRNATPATAAKPA